jgi:hypothetical protein
MLYAAYNRTNACIKLHVPNVRDDSGVTWRLRLGGVVGVGLGTVGKEVGPP